MMWDEWARGGKRSDKDDEVEAADERRWRKRGKLKNGEGKEK